MSLRCRDHVWPFFSGVVLVSPPCAFFSLRVPAVVLTPPTVNRAPANKAFKGRIFCGPLALYEYSRKVDEALRALPLFPVPYDYTAPILTSYSASIELNEVLWRFVPPEIWIGDGTGPDRSKALISILQLANEWRLTVDHARANGSTVYLPGSLQSAPKGMATFHMPKSVASQKKAKSATSSSAAAASSTSAGKRKAAPTSSSASTSKRPKVPKGSGDDGPKEEDRSFIVWEGLVSEITVTQVIDDSETTWWTRCSSGSNSPKTPTL